MSIELITALIGGTGGLGGILIAFFKYKTVVKKKEEAKAESITERDSLNHTLLSEMVTSLQEMKNILQLGFRHKVNESHQEIMQLKNLAWCKQKDELYYGLKVIIKNNGLHDKAARVSDIRDLIETVIRSTDSVLNGFNLNGYVAPTEDKIKFVNSGPAPEVLYKIITDEKNKDLQKLEDSIRLYGQKVLNSVKSEFYDSTNRVKARNAKQRTDTPRAQ